MHPAIETFAKVDRFNFQKNKLNKVLAFYSPSTPQKSTTKTFTKSCILSM